VSERLTDTAKVVLITFTEPENLDEYRARRSLSVPILVDRERTVYRSYGLGRGRFTDVWGWATIRRYVEILRASGIRRGLAEMSGGDEDTRQLGGDFVIAPNGTIVFAHRGSGPADRPDIASIAAAVSGATR
jgi:hypothetical protein